MQLKFSGTGKIVIGIFLVLALVMLSGACSNKSTNTEKKDNSTSATNGPKESASVSEDPVKFSALGLIYSKGAIPNDNVLVRMMEKKLNIDVDFQWVPSAQVGERLNVAMASGDAPDVMVLPVSTFKKWNDDGAFLDVTPYLDEFPNLKKNTGPDNWDYAEKDGKYYGFPWADLPNKGEDTIRQDWLDLTGSKMPTTIDEISTVLKKIVDSNVINPNKDKYGFTIEMSKPNSPKIFGTVKDAWVYGSFGLGNAWKEIDGQLVPSFLQPGVKPMLLWLKEQYDNGVLNQDFALNKKSVNDYMAGKSALAFVNQRLRFTSVDSTLKELDPNSKSVFIVPPNDPDGNPTYRIEESVFNILAIPASVKDENKIRAIVKMLDYLASDEGYQLMSYGIEGTHYSVEADGSWKSSKEQEEQFIKDQVSDMIYFFHPADPYQNLSKTYPKEIYDELKFHIDNSMNSKLANPAWGIDTVSEEKYGMDLNAIVNDTIVKIVMGKEPIEYLEKQQKVWKAKGGDEVIAEVNKLYAAKKK